MERFDLEGALQHYFGLPGFRPLQREIVETVLQGRSAMAILPTGGGKSLCYQLPAVLLPGVTIVISPLISLMKDQVDGLVERAIPAVAINSQDTAAEGRAKLDQLVRGKAKLAFVAPERLKNPQFLEACQQVSISLLAVDEAHCVSQWGHDFRPDYRYIKDFHQLVGAPPLLALTATARPQVEADVLTHLGIEGVPVFRGSADRPNLWMGVEHCKTVAEKKAKLVYLVRTSGGSTVVYVSSRKDAEGYASLLEAELGEPVAAYHAGLAAAERTGVQNRFMTGLCRVVVATNAFGMGIDKPDIRAVIHAGVPDSLEAYSQEIGRAGRDGLPSACTMVVVPGMDVKVREYLLEREQVDTGRVDALFRQIASLGRSEEGWLHPWGETDALALLLLSHLQAMGCIEVVQGHGGLEVGVALPLTAAHRKELLGRLEEHSRLKMEHFKRMRSYVYRSEQCRRQFLLRYFGEPPISKEADCCSTCHPRPLPEGLTLTTGSAKRKKGKASPAPSTTGSAGPAQPQPWFTGLVERLKAWRRAKAAELQVPAYIVFGDRDLESIAQVAPQTLEQLADCRGLGPRKLAAYGADVLAQVQEAVAETPAPVASEQDEPAQATPRASRAEMVARAGALFAQGAAVPAVAESLDRAEVTVWDYFLEWITTDQTGAWKAAVRQVISPDDYRAIRAALQAEEGGRLRPVHDRLEGRYSYEQIRVAQVVLQQRA